MYVHIHFFKNHLDVWQQVDVFHSWNKEETLPTDYEEWMDISNTFCQNKISSLYFLFLKEMPVIIKKAI